MAAISRLRSLVDTFRIETPDQNEAVCAAMDCTVLVRILNLDNANDRFAEPTVGILRVLGMSELCRPIQRAAFGAGSLGHLGIELESERGGYGLVLLRELASQSCRDVSF